MEIHQIEEYLKRHNSSTINGQVLEDIKNLKLVAIDNNNEQSAKDLWCLEQIFLIKENYVNAFNNMKDGEYYEAWRKLDRADIEISFLIKHFDIYTGVYNIDLISDLIKLFQKLYPYEYFSSNEMIVKKEVCTICGEEVKLRGGCTHKVGEIYMGEMCCRSVEELEFLTVAIVQNPFNKYSVVFPKGKEYNYKFVEMVINRLKSPYEQWMIDYLPMKKDTYKKIGRNDKCPCESGKKYKKCCYISGEDSYIHKRVTFLEDKSDYESGNFEISTFKD